MITKDQYQTKMMNPAENRSGSMTIEDVVREFHVPAHVVRYRLKTGDLTRVPTTRPSVYMTRRSVVDFFSTYQNEEE